MNSLNLEYLLLILYRFFTESEFQDPREQFLEAWYIAAVVASVISVVLLFGIIYSHRALLALIEENREQFLAAHPVHEPGEDLAPEGREAWEQIQEHVSSENPSNWRLAIIEADIMLDRLVASMGYPGENLGERLKSIEKGDFQSIDAAWEAHKVRNRIAHEGAAFNLSQREARRILDLYRQVFQEFQYI